MSHFYQRPEALLKANSVMTCTDSMKDYSSKVLFKDLLKKGSITFGISNFSMTFLVEA